MIEFLFGKRQELRDHRPEADELFRRVADDLGLRIERPDNDPVDLSMTLPVQDGLEHSVWLCLQNGDELWFVVGEKFTCSMFPFEDVKERFERYLRGALTG